MKKQLQILSLFVTVSFFSCSSEEKNSLFSDLNKDFSVSEELKLTPLNKLDILDRGYCKVDGSTLWYFVRDDQSVGFCYDINTGEKLSAIASIGKANNELISFEGYVLVGDSVQLFTSPNTIKTFAKKDIVENIPMGERKYSIITAPDSINVNRMIKLPNGSVLATIQNTAYSVKHQKYDINKNSIVIFNDNEAKAYETIKYDSFDLKGEENPDIDAKSLIKSAYSEAHIGVKSNDMAVLSVSRQFQLYTFDIKSGNVVKEKRYSKMQCEGSVATNDMGLDIVLMNSNDKYIVCVVEGYLSEKDKEAEKSKNAIFVFDWDLNPIKKFYFADENIQLYSISNDCKSVYVSELTDEGLTMSKADLNI